jgi:catechol 2,3-dioxygenase-like lactoylglutathione lyase family enzyme
MQLGAFSISLTVKDLTASRQFYQKFGFQPTMGDGKNWQILKNGSHIIGLAPPASSPSIPTAIRFWSISTCDRRSARWH